MNMSENNKSDQKKTKEEIDISANEMERLRRNIYRSDKEKVLLFSQMIRTYNVLKKAKVTHKKA